ncbi:hypothetical protein [Rhodococcus sp. H29-C3]|uniref:hypothetical protein n=1 Tax=Rhodococcus sp. H29-C3 TaxID=3046307 RepID=UPI0024BB78F5|nr:hypothetical protein [Rhodococcus sp. H29-C3]MDJ0363030.1 hypothetical protein [Rhodococcus sp. H29-C3]
MTRLTMAILSWTLWGLLFASIVGITAGGAMLAWDKGTCRTGHRELVLLLISGVVGSTAGFLNLVIV